MTESIVIQNVMWINDYIFWTADCRRPVAEKKGEGKVEGNRTIGVGRGVYASGNMRLET